MPTALTRPLKQTVDPSLTWSASVEDMPHRDGFSYPIFQWSFGFPGGLRGGELQVYSLQQELVFTDRRDSRPRTGKSVEEILPILEEYGWGEPDLLDKVFVTLEEVRPQREQATTIEEISQVFSTLRERWQQLLGS